MRRSFLPLGVLLALSFLASSVGATTFAPVACDSLFADADVVALVEVRSGDADACKGATVYRAVVLEAFKGCEHGATIYFGPYLSYGIGKRYVVFLERRGESIASLDCTAAGGVDAAAPYHRALYAGHGVMEVEHSCAWATHRDAPSNACDDGVRFEYTFGHRDGGLQVVLPEHVRVEPVACGSREVGLVRLDTVVKLLRRLQGRSTEHSAPRPASKPAAAEPATVER